MKAVLKSLLHSILIFFFVSNCFAGVLTFEEFKKYREITKVQAETYPSSYIKMAYAGVDIILNEKKECEIIYVSKGSPADIADIQSGDILKKIDGKKIKNRYQAFKIYDSKSPGDYVSVVVERNGTLLKKQVLLETSYLSYDLYIMMELICKEIPIRLAVIAGEMNFKHPVHQKEYDQYKELIISNVINSIEGAFIQSYKVQNNVTIIDRQHIQSILDELKFQASGLVSKEFRVKLAGMLGATHLLIISYSWIGGQGTVGYGLLTRKLIEVESGKVLATVLANVSNYKSKEKVNVSERQDLLDYKNNLSKLFVIEKEAMETYSSVSGQNYKDDRTFYYEIANVTIPKYESFVKQLINVTPETADLKNIHNLYVQGANLQLFAFKTFKIALENGDRALLNQGNENMYSAKKKIDEWVIRLNEIVRKYDHLK